jgi:aldose 1-epimerase
VVVAPSGGQFELTSGDRTAVVVEVGGGLRAFSAGGRDVVHGYAADAMCTSGRGQLLIPWPNRLQDGRYDFDGRSHQAPLNEPENGNAIHGLVRWVAWRVVEREPARVVVEHLVHPQPGYPFSLEVRVDYTLSEEGLAVRTTATNVGPDTCPYGAGAHPYLTVGTDVVDDVVLRVPARTVLRSDERSLPVGAVAVEGTEADYREPRRIGPARLDNAYTDLDRGPDGLARVELRADDGAGASLWLDAAYPYVMVFTGDLPDVGRRGLAVEPMTCPPNAFRSGDGIVLLEPGQSHTGAWGITPSAG